jgi:hypothetical protein
MKNKLMFAATSLALAGFAAAQEAAGFAEATTIVSGASALVNAVIPITATVVGIGIALSLVKLVKRK